jgi:hypothetical protein
MAVARALRTASAALRRNPTVVGIVLVLSLLQLPTQLARVAGPGVSTAVGSVSSVVALVVAPFVFGGLLGMAAEALDGTTGFGTFVEKGKRHYLSMLGAYLLLVGALIAFWFVAGFASLAVVSALGVLSGGLSGSASPVFLAMFLAGTGVFVLVLFVPLFFVQFYGQAIVLDGASAVSGFKRSIGLVRTNLVSVLGYSALVFAGGLFFGVLASIPSTLLSLQATRVPLSMPLPDLALPVVVALVVIGDVVFGLLGSLFLVFSVAFYRTLRVTGDADDPPSARGAVA